MTPKVRLGTLLLGLSIATTSPATVLTFDGLGPDGRALATTYGDRVGALDDAITGFGYGLGNGFTPNVEVSYSVDPVSGGGQGFTVWEVGYGDLVNSLGHALYDVTGDVLLTPDPGYRVTLNSFDVAAYFDDFPGSRVRVLDGDGAILFDSGPFTAEFRPGGAGPDDWFAAPLGHYSPMGDAISSASGLRIQLLDFGSLGLDNVNFEQAAVPVPATAVLLVTALAAALARARRRPRSR